MVTPKEKNVIRKAAANVVVEGKSLSSLSFKCDMYSCSGVLKPDHYVNAFVQLECGVGITSCRGISVIIVSQFGTL